MNKLRDVLESSWFVNAILLVIIINSVVLGLETSTALSDKAHHVLVMIDLSCIAVFVIEVILKLIAYHRRYFLSGWRVFDFLIVLISVIPAANYISVLRALRIFRALRLISTVPTMRRVVDALTHSIPGLMSTALLLMLIFYVASVMATVMFHADFPAWFGNIGRSLFSLFQIMTLESWSMGIVRPVLEKFPYAWTFFVPFILISAFILLNFLIGIIVDAIAHLKQKEDENVLMTEIKALEKKIDVIASRLDER